MNKVLSFFSVAFLLSFTTQAQNMQPCGLDEIRQKMMQEHPEMQQDARRYEEQQALYAQFSHMQKSTAFGDTIPVVFHIVLRPVQMSQLGGMQGIIARCNSQIKALNRDYNAGNADSVGIPAAFKPLYGNAKVHFALAHTDPQGAATPGFTIDTATINGFDPAAQGTAGSGYICSDAKYASSGGANAWNTARYLNVWVVNTAPNGTMGGFIAGIATHPSMSNYIPAQEFGTVIHYLSFGNRESGSQTFINGLDSGRVLVHEVGHFLGLWHVWGNDQGGCSSDDGIADTPPQDFSTQTSACPAFPLTDACSPNGPGVMFMNYMDYSPESCQHMFSLGQVTRMTNALTQSYPQLTEYPELTRYPVSTSLSSLEETGAGIIISPNPARNTARIDISNGEALKQIVVLNNMGQMVKTIPAEQGRTNYTLDVQGFASGMYFVQCRFADGVKIEKLVVNQ